MSSVEPISAAEEQGAATSLDAARAALARAADGLHRDGTRYGMHRRVTTRGRAATLRQLKKRWRKEPSQAIDARQPLALADAPELIGTAPSTNAQSDRPTMDLPTQTHLTKLRDLLTCRLLELRAAVHAAEQAQQEPTGAAAHEVTDRKEEAAQRLLSDLRGALEQRDLDEMAEVESALHRLEIGTYGDCTDCGEPISPGRLQVQPAAQRCAPCQAACEHALDRSSPRRAP